MAVAAYQIGDFRESLGAAGVLATISRFLQRMRRRALVAGGVAIIGLAVFAASHAATSAADVMQVRLGGDALQTRIVVDLGRSVTGKLISDGASDGRVVLLLPDATAPAGQQGTGRWLVKRWALDQVRGGARLQMDIAPDSRVTRRFLLPPADGVDRYRYVLDVAPINPGSVRLTKAEAPKLALRPGLLPARAPALALKKVVVIDAGHGGRDPGAHGAVGLEKDVNLAAARALKARLERAGRYRVVMTRDADVFIPLETRVRIAQRAGADLFISLHSDSGPDPSVRGASVYTLSDKASSRAARFVSRQDWFMKASVTGDRRVSDILLDLTQRATKNRSAMFAETIIRHVEGRSPLLSRTHRDAGFMVLLAPEVPAVLLEMGFISNPEDEAMLRNRVLRARLMNAVGDSIDEYFAGSTTRLAAR